VLPTKPFSNWLVRSFVFIKLIIFRFSDKLLELNSGKQKMVGKKHYHPLRANAFYPITPRPYSRGPFVRYSILSAVRPGSP
jgi:hypothetical protein